MGPLFWSAASDLAAKAAVLISAFAAARALAPIRFGQLVGFSAAALLASSIWDVGLTTLATREVAARRLTIRDAVWQVAALRVRASPVWLLTFAIGGLVLTRGHPIRATAVLAFAGASVAFSFHAVLTALLRARMRFRYAGVSIACGRWLTAFLSITAAVLGGTERPFILLSIALLAGEGLTLAMTGVGVLQEIRRDNPRPLASRRLSLGQALPFAANGLLSMAYNRLDVLILAGLSTSAQLSLYAPASRIQDAMYLIPSSIGLIALPLMARARVDEIRGLITRLTVVGICLAIPLLAVAFLLAPQIIRFVLGSSYEGAATPTRILIWFLPLAVVQAPLLAALTATGRGLDTTKIIGATFITAVAMHLSLDWWWGATGAAIASLSRDPVAVLVAIHLSKKAGVIGPKRFEETFEINRAPIPVVTTFGGNG